MIKKYLNSPYTKILLLVVFLYFLINKTDFDVLYETLQKTSLRNLFFAFTFKIFGVITSVYVLYSILILIEQKTKWKPLANIYFSSYFFNNFGLGSLGGDSFKWLKLNSITGSGIKTTLALYNEKIFGFSVLVSFVTISTVLHWLRVFNVFWYMLVLPLSTGLILLYFLLVKIFLKIKFIQNSKLPGFFIRKDLILGGDLVILGLAIFSSFLFYIFVILSFYFLYITIDSYIPIYVAFFAIPIVIFINTIPISFQGFGVREVSIAFLFQYLGFSFETGVAAAVLLFVLNLSVLSGFYFFLQKEQWCRRAIPS
jgi:uncharacterized membrane protein YbhN (UPF0104 family)